MTQLAMVNGAHVGQAPGGEVLSYGQARQSPCASCATSPCCTYVRLSTFEMDTLSHVDYAFYLLNFDHLELGLRASGQWTVFYRAPCRFLDRRDFSCTIHDSPRQPRVCVHYSPYDCWYRRLLGSSVSDEFLRIDRTRFQFVVDRLTFDDDRNIVDTPSWDILLEGFAHLPMAPISEGLDDSTPAQALHVLPMAASSDGVSAADRCDSCSAYCCTYVSFPQDPPRTLADLDHFQYMLGFTGLELGISNDGWSAVVRSRCRHLVGNRCSIFGQPERPLRCKYYDAWKCTYKPRFEGNDQAGYARVQIDQFPSLLECFSYDGNGAIVGGPSAEELRRHLGTVGKPALTC